MPPKSRQSSACSRKVAARSRTPRRARRGQTHSNNLTPPKIDTVCSGIQQVAVAPRVCPERLMDRAARALQPASFSGRLPCRDKEQNKISSYLRAAIRRGGTDQVLYISGMPGTGKTAALLQAIRELEGTTSKAQDQSFVFVHINAMRLFTPNAVFGDILSRLPRSGRNAKANATRANAADQARSFFASRRKQDPVVVMLIDEIDQLVTKKQSVMYTVFDWLSLRSARLVVTAISNTMDLPERLLPRVASRFEIVRVDFSPYSRDQIHRILSERLRAHSATKAFEQEALRRCAARVASGSGDVRKALQLCRRALELRRHPVQRLEDSQAAAALEPEEKPVDCKLLEDSAKELLFANPASKAIAGLSSRTRRLLSCIVLELRRQDSDSEVIQLRKVAAKYEKLAVGIGGEIPSEGTHAEDAFVIANRLVSTSLLTHGHVTMAAKNHQDHGVVLRLGCGLDFEDLKNALLDVEEDPGMRNILLG